MSTLDNPDKLFEIIEGCIRGDRSNQQKMYELLYGKMLAVCIRYTREREDAVDVLQEGFIKVFANIRQFESTGSFEGWVRKIMVNTAIDFFRKNKKMIVYSNSEYVENNAEDIKEEETGDDEYMNVSPDKIMEAVQQLTPQYRTVFNMYVVDGYTHKEIAQELGINEGTSKSNYSKAKMNLKKALSKKIKEVNAH